MTDAPDTTAADAAAPGGAAGSFVSRIVVAMNSDATVPRVTTLALRFYLASAIFLEVKNKIGPKWAGWLDWMPTDLVENAHHDLGFYQIFLAAIVEPHARVFAGLVAFGELGVCIALFLGGMTRLAAAVGIFLTMNYALLNAAGTPLSVSNDCALLVGFLVVLLTAPGRVLGVDAYLSKRWPRSILW